MKNDFLRRSVLIFICNYFIFGHLDCLDNGLALTPPMGWNTWLELSCNVDCSVNPKKCLNEKNVREIADRMASDGYKDAGYQYVGIDDCWLMKSRGPDGRQVPDPVRFPSGMKALADYIHNKGLKFGIYSDIGVQTCAGYPGSQFYLELDAQTYADWGVDFLKVDGCYADALYIDQGFKALGLFLNLTKRPILYACEWPAYDLASLMRPNYTDIRSTCNTWRTFLDMHPSWNAMFRILAFWAINPFNISSFAGPGGWNDPDFLLAGSNSLTADQETLQMAVWAIVGAPLTMAADLREISSTSRNLLINKSLIDINQDQLGVAGKMVKAVGELQYWKRPLYPSPTTFAIAVANVDPTISKNLQACLGDFDLSINSSSDIYDVLSAKIMCSNCSCIALSLRPTSIAVMKVTKHMN